MMYDEDDFYFDFKDDADALISGGMQAAEAWAKLRAQYLPQPAAAAGPAAGGQGAPRGAAPAAAQPLAAQPQQGQPAGVALAAPQPNAGEGGDDTWPEPAMLWGTGTVPDMPPRHALPALVYDFACAMSHLRGLDGGGIAMSGLGTLAGAIPDSMQVRVMPNDNWFESPRLWVSLVGMPSTGKSPSIDAAFGAYGTIHSGRMKQHTEAFAEARKADPKAVPAPVEQLVVDDITVESAADVCAENQDGALLKTGELSGWFGRMGAYSGSGAASKDRAFWLIAYDGGSTTVNRRGRAVPLHIERLSVGIIGGIQPDMMQDAASDGDDGLIARFLPVVLRKPNPTADVDVSAIRNEYDATVRLFANMRVKDDDGRTYFNPTLRFSPGAQQVFARIAKQRSHLVEAFEHVSPMLAGHLGKWTGTAARLAGLFHAIENRHTMVPGTQHGAFPEEITVATMLMVEALLNDYLLPHAVAFYLDTLSHTVKDGGPMRDVADTILGRGLTEIKHRDITGGRGTRATNSLDTQKTERLFELLASFGWLRRGKTKQRNSQPWHVNPRVHEIYAQRAEDVAARNAKTHAVMKALGR